DPPGPREPGPAGPGEWPPSVLEVPLPGEDHGEALLVRGLDDLLVADRAAGLDHRGRARRRGGVEAVAEREERIRRARPTDRAARRLLGGDAPRVPAVLLPRADADGLAVLHQHDRVRGDPRDEAPRELEVEPLLLGRVALGDHTPR